MSRRLISIVIPVMNERDNVAEVHRRVSDVFTRMLPDYDYELVFTDNHSTDGTFETIAAIAADDARVRAFRFSRNFGFQRSILEGYRHALGEAAIQLDADLQDPPELIPEFISRWEDGAEVVYGVRAVRRESAILSGARRVFYRLIAVLSEDSLQIDAGDFRLIDRRILDVLTRLEDSQPYLRGTIAAMGFEQVGVAYERSERTSGASKFAFRQLMALSLDGILNHSIVPLRVASYTGMLVALLTALGAVAFIIGRLAFGQEWPPGFATTTLLIMLGIALNAVFLGIIGEYVGRIYRQVKRGPNTIIEREIDAAARPHAQEHSDS